MKNSRISLNVEIGQRGKRACETYVLDDSRIWYLTTLPNTPLSISEACSNTKHVWKGVNKSNSIFLTISKNTN